MITPAVTHLIGGLLESIQTTEGGLSAYLAEKLDCDADMSDPYRPCELHKEIAGLLTQFFLPTLTIPLRILSEPKSVSY